MKRKTIPRSTSRSRKQSTVQAVEAIAGVLKQFRPKPKVDQVLRWTIDRVDTQAEVVRVEQVPMKQDRIGKNIFKRLTRWRSNETEQLSWWDTERRKALMLTPRTVRRKLGLHGEAPLAENMVFWIQVPGRAAAKATVFHATRAARKLSKSLYAEASKIEIE